jgi:hypothetical protein
VTTRGAENTESIGHRDTEAFFLKSQEISVSLCLCVSVADPLRDLRSLDGLAA